MWNCSDPIIWDLTAECSNNSSSKVGDATTPLLARNRKVKGSFWPSPRILVISDSVTQFERIYITYTGPTRTVQVMDKPLRKILDFWGLCFGKRKKPERERAQRVGLRKSCESTVVRCILSAKLKLVSNK